MVTQLKVTQLNDVRFMMQRYLIFVFIVTLALVADTLQAQSIASTAQMAVYRLEIRGCTFEGAAPRSQIGFQVTGLVGIVTTLHGLADCTEVSATTADGQIVFEQLVITQVDLLHDIALLASPALSKASNGGLRISPLADLTTEPLTLVNDHDESRTSTRQRVTGIVARESLDAVIPDDLESVDLIKRKSPDLKITVLTLALPLLSGQAGAPLVDSKGRLIGVAQGGIADGGTAYSWAIPWQEIRLKAITQEPVRTQFVDLQQRDPLVAFAFSSTFLPPTAALLPYQARVIDEQGSPIANAEVTVSHSAGVEMGYTDTEGVVFLQLPAAMEYTRSEITITAAGYANYRVRLIDPLHQTDENFFRLVQTGAEAMTSTGPATNRYCTFAFRTLDQATGAPITKATIYTDLGTRQATGQTDSTGYYSSQLPCDEEQNSQVRIRVVAAGYQSHSETVPLVGEVKDITLAPEIVTPTRSPSIALFRIGDWVQAVPALRLRAEPGLQATIRETLAHQETFVIRGGPIEADGYVWWQLQEISGALRGWAAFVIDEEEQSLTIAPYQTPTPAVVVAPPSSARPSTALLEIIKPKAQESIIGKYEVRWRYRGELAPGQGFDLILWYPEDDKRRGITDAKTIAQQVVRHNNGEYSVALNFSGAPVVAQFCNASYWLIVTVVQLDPYQPTGIESQGINVQVRPFPGSVCG